MWGSLGPYGGGILWNQAPWLNNQDLFVLKDDYSAVFGKHFVKAGVLVSYNKKNEEPPTRRRSRCRSTARPATWARAATSRA